MKKIKSPSDFRHASELLKEEAKRHANRKRVYLSVRPGFFETASLEEVDFVEREELFDPKRRKLSMKRWVAKRRAELEKAK